MPLLSSNYKSPLYLRYNSVLQTIVPNTRQIKLSYQRERLMLSDGDFVDLDWLLSESKKLVILTHGLAGCSEDVYVKGTADYLHQSGWEVLAWNCRSCSGEMNRKLRLYFHGEIGDIHEVIQHALDRKDYQTIALVGFSMGGAITLKYLGVQAANFFPQIKKAVAVSTPCNLESSAIKIDAPINWYFKRRMFVPLKEKALYKAKTYPEYLNAENIKYVKTWRDFDEYFSAPINGYTSAKALYEDGSAIRFMEGIQVSTLLLNAKNDPILTPDAFPEALCREHAYIKLETPSQGGHVGFPTRTWRRAWSERRILEFLEH